MINLAGVKTCDETIQQELKEAGIKAVMVGKRERREVPSEYIGVSNNFIFTRAWYYWVVTGYMPLQYAKEMYEKYKDLNIRVAGHCGNPPPEEWCKPKNHVERCQPIVDQFWDHKISHEECDERCRELRKQGDQFVDCYHIDTQEGLNCFVETIKNNGIIG
ncbi:MAG: hypothetical protein WC998_04415 [Candidatus Paceibacterota bacterium]|jgi:hypothetical protein